MEQSLKSIRHFHSRFGFGLSLGKFIGFEKSGKFSPEKIVMDSFKPEGYRPLEFTKNLEPIQFKELRGMSSADRQNFVKDDRLNTIALSGAWITEMVQTIDPLREKMSLFWHDHFPCKPKTSFMAGAYVELLRKEAVGNFRSLLHGVAKEPAMLLYLNNQQNRKGHPNENFAREVMELFTLGIGNYSENDIKESARAFTGWTVGPDKKFKLNDRQHDFGKKTFFGESKSWTGEEVIDRLLEERETAAFVSAKIARYFIGSMPSEDLQSAMTKAFYESGYEISTVLLAIIRSEDFWTDEVIGQDILSPIELLVKMERDFHLESDNELSRIAVQKSLGQILLQPPNVSGWPSGKDWIDASTLPIRLSLARAALLNTDYRLHTNQSFAKGEDLAENIRSKAKKGFRFKSNITPIEKAFGHLSYSEQTGELARWLLPETVLKENEMVEEIKRLNFEGTRGALALVASLPEYQLK